MKINSLSSPLSSRMLRRRSWSASLCEATAGWERGEAAVLGSDEMAQTRLISLGFQEQRQAGKRLGQSQVLEFLIFLRKK